MDQCSSTTEVQTILEETYGLANVMGCDGHKRLRSTDVKIPRLIAASALYQKEFVGHMYCQQALRKEWYGEIKWQKETSLYKV